MSTQRAVLSFRLPHEERSRLERLARRMGRTLGELAARMVIEGRRREDFAWIDFRNSASGRMAFLQGTRLQVWWLARLARQLKGDPGAVAEHLGLPLAQVKAALNYALAFPDEIETSIRALKYLRRPRSPRARPASEAAAGIASPPLSTRTQGATRPASGRS
jgi:uncharacterized protein (DUF433 family)